MTRSFRMAQSALFGSRVLAFSLLLAAASHASAGEAVDYVRDIKPVLKERCFACHAALKQENGLRVDTAASLRSGGESGPAVVAGKPGESLLLSRVTANDDTERMPPEGKPLTPEQIARLSVWIASGAEGPADEQPEADPRRHWAFQPPRRPALPGVAAAAERNPIDALLAAAQRRRGIKPVGEAPKSLLLRRVYLDLIGLPPTRQQLHAFLADEQPDAYERVVEELLASPHYGERWGRHWMDVWRYSDWFGLGDQLRNSQKHIWHWRDWIVESLNADKGYDQMIVEMLAGDEVAPADRGTLRATGFLARNYYLFNRTTWLDDTIEHTSKAFLGLTINCAKCHDHKYDPISQLDYYRLRAVFEPHQVRLDPLPGQVDLERDGLPRVFDAHLDAATWLHKRGNEQDPDKTRAIEPGAPASLAGDIAAAPVDLPPEALNPALQAFVIEDQVRAAERDVSQKRAALSKARDELAAAEKRAAEASTAPAGNPAGGKVIVEDDFAQEKADTWETGSGQWKYEGGHLVQSQTGATRAYLRTRNNHPADFHARLKVKITGGDMWRSVGLSFDAAREHEKLVYISAYAGGPKLQIAHNVGAGYVYPADAAQARPIEAGKLYQLDLQVRGRLVNVAIDGQHALAFWLPVEREPGRLDVITFDATAEFYRFELQGLPADAMLVPARGQQQQTTAAQARLAVAAAEKALATAELRPDLLRAAHAADLAQCHGTTGDELTRAIQAAALASRRYEHAKTLEQTALAEQKLAAADDKSRPEVEKQLAAARDAAAKAEAALAQPGDKYLPIRGSLKALEGPAETAESRDAPYPQTSSGRRTALARWIVARDNPLTARVAVNQIWMRHFGQPLVESVEDFGRRAPRPPLEAVLDWLAVELLESHWSMKHLHRLMVTSSAYRLSASIVAADEATLKGDPNNAYYWRRRPLRMESQVVRDSLLQLAGALDVRMGGPTIDPKQDASVFRRSLYFTHSRDDRNEFLAMFDDADILRCYRRTESIVPQQALTMANSRLTLAMARQLSARLNQDLGPVDDATFINAAFETILAVSADERERTACLESLARIKQWLVADKHPQAEMRAREDLVHALFNHNDFVTIR